MNRDWWGEDLLQLDEPLLEFGYGQRLAYPRDGLFLFGPVDRGSAPAISFGAIGTTEGVRRLRSWAESVSRFIPVPEARPGSKLIQAHHVPFPGVSTAFESAWPVRPSRTIETIDAELIDRALRIENRHEAVKAVVDMFVEPLVEECQRIEDPPAFWFVVIPEQVYTFGRQRSPRLQDRVPGKVRMGLRMARDVRATGSLFDELEEEAKVYEFLPDFRRQLKARLLGEKVVTQVVRETTLAPGDFLTDSGRPTRRLEDPATVAWKLCTASYYKSGGRPWQLADVREGVCYVGLAYKKTNSLLDDRNACCAAQMFLSDGEGVVFRGALGPWYQPETRQFHLDEDEARRLMTTVVEEYRRAKGRLPSELFVHAKSAFTDDEWRGFRLGVDGAATNLVGVQIRATRHEVKLFRMGRYPVIRGTAMRLSESFAYLWTSGYVPRLDTYMGPETPNPVIVSVRRGRCEFPVVLADVMRLTKINFNSCLFNDQLPVTIRFADDVGDILTSAPMGGERRLPFKFYI